MTDGEGRHRLIALPAGRYELMSELSGFRSVVRKGIVPTISMRANENITMAVAAVRKVLTVTGGIANRRDYFVSGRRDVYAHRRRGTAAVWAVRSSASGRISLSGASDAFERPATACRSSESVQAEGQSVAPALDSAGGAWAGQGSASPLPPLRLVAPLTRPARSRP